MLSTPGRSPRFLPPLPSPSPSPSNKKGQDGKGIMASPYSRPPKVKKRRATEVEVLDEDSYVEAIEHIVQRDYFPDLPRLQDRLEWLEAIRTGDPEVIRAAQLRIVTRRAKREQISGGSGTPMSGRGTPASAVGVTPRASLGSVGGYSLGGGLRTPGGGSVIGASETEEDEEAAAKWKARARMTLDEFLLTHTSQDNASFSVLKEKENKKRREKVAHLYLLEAPAGSQSAAGASSSSSQALSLQAGASGGKTSAAGEDDGSRKTDGYGSTGQPTSTLEMWPYKAKNALMYNSSTREDAPLTPDEIAERSMGPPKQVKYRNTRFRNAQVEQQGDAVKQSLEDKVAILYDPIPGETPIRYIDPMGERGSRKHYDLEDLRRTPKSSTAAGTDADGAADQAAAVPSVGLDGKPTVYEYVSTPNFVPGEGADASPFMTWGDIDSTPLRLEAEDTPVGIGGSVDGPHFSIAAAPTRDKVAINMSRAAARSMKERERMKESGASEPSPGLRFGMSPGAKGKGGGTPGMSPARFSPAAQKLVSQSARGKGGRSFDVTLRASYAASPHRTPSRLSSASKVMESACKSSEKGKCT